MAPIVSAQSVFKAVFLFPRVFLESAIALITNLHVQSGSAPVECVYQSPFFLSCPAQENSVVVQRQIGVLDNFCFSSFLAVFTSI